jgi:hypothetical protein
MGLIHFIVVGEEPPSLHLAGVQRFGCAKAVLFAEGEEPSEVEGILERLGTRYERVNVGLDYLKIRERASKESASAFNEGHTVAVNMSSGNRMVVEVVEEAVRLQQHYLIRHTANVSVSAFRYFCDPRSGKLTYIPYWNSYDFFYTTLFETLLSRKEGLTLDEFHKEIVRAMGEAAPNWEAFRKHFREFRRYLVNLPFYSEGRGRRARYALRIEDT